MTFTTDQTGQADHAAGADTYTSLRPGAARAREVAQASQEPKRERRLIRIADVAARFGVTRSAIYGYAAKDAAWPEPIKVAGSVFYVESDIEDYLDHLERQAATRAAARAERIAARK